MSVDTKIEWCDSTWNPWIGCTKVGPGCDHCYAEREFDHRRHRAKWGAGQERSRTSVNNWIVADADGSYSDGWRRALQMGRHRSAGKAAQDGDAEGTEWAAEPGVGILAHGVAQRVEQLTALGNGQVPAVVRKAWRILTHNAKAVGLADDLSGQSRTSDGLCPGASSEKE